MIGTIFEGQNRKTASLSEMPPHLLDAVIAKEDERFREHGGVDLWGIIRALWVDIRAGEAVEGASTITQQYVRNAYLSQDRSITRKIKDALIAIEVEREQDSKDHICGPVAEPRRGAAASASASSIAPRHSRAQRAGAWRYTAAPSSASAASR